MNLLGPEQMSTRGNYRYFGLWRRASVGAKTAGSSCTCSSFSHDP